MVPERPRLTAPPMRSSQFPRASPLERKILLGLLALLSVGAAFVLAPFWPWFVLALWTASLMRPMVDRLTVATRGRARASGLAIVLLLVAALVPVALCGLVVAVDAQRLLRSILASSSGRAALEQLVASGSESHDTVPLTHLRSLDPEAIALLFREHGPAAFSAFADLAGTLSGVFLGIFVYFAATYAALVHGRDAYGWFEAQVPLSPARLERFREAFQETGRGLLFSVALTGLVQALVATVAYVALGVPRAAALGFATFLASFVPTIGATLVWAPVGIGLVLAGSTTKGVVLLAVGVIIISSVDNVLRPLFARWGSLTLDPYLVLFSMLGGVLVLGGFGLILGPLVVRLTLEATRLVREQSRSVLVAAGEEPPRRTRPSLVNLER